VRSEGNFFDVSQHGYEVVETEHDRAKRKEPAWRVAILAGLVAARGRRSRLPSFEPSASKPRDSDLKREQNPRYRHDNGLILAALPQPDQEAD